MSAPERQVSQDWFGDGGDIAIAGVALTPSRGISDPFQLRTFVIPAPSQVEIADAFSSASDDNSVDFSSVHEVVGHVGQLPPLADPLEVPVMPAATRDPALALNSEANSMVDESPFMGSQMEVPLHERQSSGGSWGSSQGGDSSTSAISPARVGTVPALSKPSLANGRSRHAMAATSSSISSPYSPGLSPMVAPQNLNTMQSEEDEDGEESPHSEETQHHHQQQQQQQQQRTIGRKRARRQPQRRQRKSAQQQEEERQQQEEEEEEEEDDEENLSGLSKRDRNKLSAAKYRKRRKMYLSTLEHRVENLQDTVKQQRQTMSSMEQENTLMKEQLAFLKRLLASTGAPLPELEPPAAETETKTTKDTQQAKQEVAGDGGKSTRSSRRRRRGNGAGADANNAVPGAASAMLFAVFTCFLLSGSLTTTNEQQQQRIATSALTSALSPSVASLETDVIPSPRRVGGGRMLLSVDLLGDPDAPFGLEGKVADSSALNNNHKDVLGVLPLINSAADYTDITAPVHRHHVQDNSTDSQTDSQRQAVVTHTAWNTETKKSQPVC